MELSAKVYMAVIVLAVILVGMVIYLFLMDRKIGKLEKEIKEKKQKQEA